MPIKDFYTKREPLVVFKWVTGTGRAPWGRGDWDLPKGGVRGKVRSIGKQLPEICRLGIHGYKNFTQLRHGLKSHRLYIAEIWGNVVEGDGKVAGQRGCLCYEVVPRGCLCWNDIWIAYSNAEVALSDKFKNKWPRTPQGNKEYNESFNEAMKIVAAAMQSLMVKVTD